MKIGKVPNDVLKEIILGKIRYNRSEVMLRPKIGEDCCAVDFGEYACVMSSDPITGAVGEIGRIAVHINCNDIASSGVEPIGLMVTILAPPGATENELEAIMQQLCDTANSLNVDILGGHTEVTAAVNRFVIMSTAIGRIVKEKLVTTSGAKPGDSVVITKSAGIEGTSVIAHDREEDMLRQFGREWVERAKALVEKVSVVKEGIIAGSYGVNAMHDATEGGVLGAVWEIAEASGTGVEIYESNIPVLPETGDLCSYYEIDPLKLISSGCMVISCADGEGLVDKLAQSGIEASVIGKITASGCKLIKRDSTVEEILQPESDELYKVIS